MSNNERAEVVTPEPQKKKNQTKKIIPYLVAMAIAITNKSIYLHFTVAVNGSDIQKIQAGVLVQSSLIFLTCFFNFGV